MIDLKRLTSGGQFDLVAMIRLLAQLTSENENGITIEEGELREALNGLHSYTFIAFDTEGDPDQYLGTATLLIRRNFTKWVGSIHNVVVDSGYRGNGIGELLLNKLLDIARQFSRSENIGLEISLTCHPNRTAANLLYTKIGFILSAKANGPTGTNLYSYNIAAPQGLS